MGQRVTQFDDLDETVTTDIETVRFGYEGKQYDIDLGVENRVRFAEFIEEFVEKAKEVTDEKPKTLRSVPASAPRAAGGRSAAATARTARIRDWARENGHEVKDGGRIKNDIIRAFEEANPDDTLEAALAAEEENAG